MPLCQVFVEDAAIGQAGEYVGAGFVQIDGDLLRLLSERVFGFVQPLLHLPIGVGHLGHQVEVARRLRVGLLRDGLGVGFDGVHPFAALVDVADERVRPLIEAAHQAFHLVGVGRIGRGEHAAAPGQINAEHQAKRQRRSCGQSPEHEDAYGIHNLITFPARRNA